MKYAILAAGEGSRLQQEGVQLPKPLVELNDEAMIDRLIRIFMMNDAEEIFIITNNLTTQTQQHIRELIDEGLPIRLVVKTTPSSMHSFYELMPLLGEGKFCMTTVDTIFREDEFSSYISAFQQYEGDAFMALTDFIDDEKPLYISTDNDLNISGFHDTFEDGIKYISGGIYCLTDKVFPVLEDCMTAGKSRMRNFQRQLVSEGLRVKAYPFSKILDVDHAEDIRKAEEFLHGNTTDTEKGRALLIFRALKFSPNMAEKDRKILLNVGNRLQIQGYAIRYLMEEEFTKPIEGVDVVLTMCRSEKAIELLKQMEQQGVKVINTAESIENCSRHRFVALLENAGTPMPKQYSKDSFRLPLWLKSPHGWSLSKDDVLYVSTEEELEQAIADKEYMMFEHLEGDLIKFYGVNGTDYFSWRYASDSNGKFGLESHNGSIRGYSFEEDNLREICRNASNMLGLIAYGGDCIIDEGGVVRLIDLNDWPSYSSDADNAAEAICQVACK